MAKKKVTKKVAKPSSDNNPKKSGRKKVDLPLEERIKQIFDLEKKIADGIKDPKERFNTMWKKNKLKRDLKKEGHEIPKKLDDLIQPKLSGWFQAESHLSMVDLLIYKIAYSKSFEKKIKDNVERLRKFKQMKKAR